ncbi:MAG: biotin--[Lentisphaeria bacterium]|nr:biotin--[acetyl-CoA-carboxylase] ligase [Lentisphaeria bacterium]
MEKIVFLESVNSTNTYVKEHFDELEDGTLVVTFNQTAGRGRLNRHWHSPPGMNIAATAVLKQISDGFHAGAILGVAALECIAEIAPDLPAFLKWPNDIYVEDRKLAGILCEGAKIENGHVTGVAAGIGINVNLPEEFLKKIDQPATSLAFLKKTEFNLLFLSKKLEKSLNRYYITYLNSHKTLLAQWQAANLLIGETVSVVDAAGRRMTGVFESIAGDGTLMLNTAEGVLPFSCGDVKIDRGSVDWKKLSRKVVQNRKGTT